MNAVATVSAVQIPSTSSGGNSGGALRHGSGTCQNASTVMIATAKIASAMTGGRDRIVAATVTGARIRIENGFCSPPVKYKRRPSCSRS